MSKLLTWSANCLLLAVIVCSTAQAGNSCNEALTIPDASLFKVDKNYKYLGLSQTGLRKIGIERANLIKLHEFAATRLFNAEAFTEATNIAKVGKYNILALGRPGGGKTYFFNTLTPRLWIKQMHQMMTEMSLIGGQTEAGAKAGTEDINTATSLVEAEFAMIDEGEKANSSVLATLLSALNERLVFIAGKARKIATRTIIFTGNATLNQLLDKFRLENQETTGAAFLNRFHFKFQMPNWLEEKYQKANDQLMSRRKYLRAVEKDPAKLAILQEFQEAPVLDWQSLEDFSFGAFQESEELGDAARSLANTLMENTNLKIAGSFKDREKNPKSPLYTSPAEFSERLRLEIINVIKVSAALDFLKSPLSNSKNLAKNTKQKIVLGPLSLWRAHALLTTIGPGRVIFDPRTRTIHFGVVGTEDGNYIYDDTAYRIKTAPSPRDADELTNMQMDQKEFSSVLASKWDALSKGAEESSGLKQQANGDLNGDVEFEEKLSAANTKSSEL